jgi:MFS family permease
MESVTPVRDAGADKAPPDTTRWVQLLLGVIAMMAISSPQYVWTLFTGPLNTKLGTTLAEIQVTFSLLIVLQTFFSPFQAYLVDRFGPKLLISIGAIMSGGSWVLAAPVNNLTALYITYGVIGGFGTGIVYVGIIGLMVRWFPDRKREAGPSCSSSSLASTP